MINKSNILNTLFQQQQKAHGSVYKAILVATALVIMTSACSSSGSGSTNNQPITFSGTPQAQSRDCTAVTKLAPEQSNVRYVGNIWREEVDSDAEFTQLWNQLTPENAGKWGEVEPVQDKMQWERLDAAIAFARNNAMPYKFHTLVWGANQPKWLSALSPEQQRVEIEQWMNQLATRYPSVEQIDVINEPLHAPPNYLSALNPSSDITLTPTRWAWVSNTFAQARQKFPNSELLLNDFNILLSDENTTDYLEIITLLQAEALIDGIGLQGHFLENTNAEIIRANLNRLGATGLPVYISEFDLNIADDQQQLERMQLLFPLFYSSKYVKGITFWGYRENQLWQENSRLINADGTKRPAMKWLECYLANAR